MNAISMTQRLLSGVPACLLKEIFLKTVIVFWPFSGILWKMNYLLLVVYRTTQDPVYTHLASQCLHYYLINLWDRRLATCPYMDTNVCGKMFDVRRYILKICKNSQNCQYTVAIS